MAATVPVLPPAQLDSSDARLRECAAPRSGAPTLLGRCRFPRLRRRSAVMAEVDVRRLVRPIDTLHELHRPHLHPRERPAGLDRFGRVVLGFPEVGGQESARRCSSPISAPSRRASALRSLLPRGSSNLVAKPRNGCFRHPPLPRILPHRAGTRLRADLRRRLRPRTAARRARHRHPHHGRARQAVRRSRREHRHEALRGRDVDRRHLDRGGPLRRSCRRCCRTSPATACCASRSTCAAPPSWASSAPAASARTCSRRSASSTTPTSAPCCS